MAAKMAAVTAMRMGVQMAVVMAAMRVSYLVFRTDDLMEIERVGQWV